MKTEKVSLSLDADLLAEARKHAHGHSLSSYVNAGLRQKVFNDRLGVLLDEWEDEFGPIPEEIVAEMTALWPG